MKSLLEGTFFILLTFVSKYNRPHGIIRFFKKETIALFTSYQGISRRGLGFDKPEHDNETRSEPYPSRSCSSQTFGHTGFTGTCVWTDPKEDIIFVFLSNRIYQDEGVFKSLNLRSKIQDCVYRFAKEITIDKTQPIH